MKEQLYNILIKLLANDKISVNQEELKLQLLSHPSYPSLHSVTGVLNHFRIYNLAFRLPVNMETINELPNSFIAHLKTNEENDLVLVENRNGKFRITYDYKRSRLLSYEDFANEWDGVVLVIEKDENVTEIAKNKYGSISNYLFYVLLGLLLSLIIFSNASLFSVVHFSLSLLGLFLSILILKIETGIQSTIGNSICNIAEEGNCETVLNSKGADFFGILKLSDLCLITFSTYTLTWVLYFISGETHFMPLLIMTLAAMPFSIYSLYYQHVIIKKWCLLCVGIVAILFMQSISLFLGEGSIYLISLNSIILLLFSFFTTVSLGYYILSLYRSNNVLENKEVEHYKFKRNFVLFRTLFESSRTLTKAPTIEGEIILGNKDAPLTVILITNPICHFCKESHEDIISILDKAQDKIKIIIRFNTNIYAEGKKAYQITSELLRVYNTEDTKTFMKSLDFFYGKNADIPKWLKNNQSQNMNFSYDKILMAQHNWCKENGLNFTPILILNDKEYPIEYDRKDLIYFMDELIELQKKESIQLVEDFSRRLLQ